MHSDIIDPPFAHGAPIFRAVLKRAAADFQVHENLHIDFTGEGEHLYLQVEKTAMNTDEVVSLLQTCYSVGSADVGLCGLKDRHSISTQWFSVRTALGGELFADKCNEFNEQQVAQWGEDDKFLKCLRVVQHQRHSRKLRHGAHESNHFAITLHEVNTLPSFEGELRTAVDARISALSQCGFPAYIGAQRFGEGARNVQRAKAWLANPRKRTSRQQRSLWLSSARSAMFNIVCAERVREGSWQQILPGEPLVLAGSRSFFMPHTADDQQIANSDALISPSDSVSSDNQNSSAAIDVTSDSELQARLDQFDIHPSAPWWGRGRTPAIAHCEELESRVLQPYKVFLDGLERAGLSQERRAIRATASDLQASWLSDDALQLQFSLAPGVFATSLVREIATVIEPER